MKVENLTDYLLPLIIFIFYFVVSQLKRKQKALKERPKDSQTFPSSHLPPSSRHPRPETENRRIDLNTRKEEVNQIVYGPEVSVEALEDPFYANLSSKNHSRAKQLLKKKSSLRKALILKEILNRPRDAF